MSSMLAEKFLYKIFIPFKKLNFILKRMQCCCNNEIHSHADSHNELQR